jgi:DNA repair protein SbcD/Mre11
MEAEMAPGPVRFLHASDLHLEQPARGVADVPDHLRELFLECPYAAARRVFEAALTREVDFVVLSGDVVDARRSGPRGAVFLAEQFGRLAERSIGVFWASGRADPVDAWPGGVELPQNVVRFPAGRVEGHVIRRDGRPIARVLGAGRDRRRKLSPRDFAAPDDGLPAVAALYGRTDPAALRGRGIDYWALGGRHRRETLCEGAVTAHFPGTPQGRRDEEPGAHGCTLVEIDQQRAVWLTELAADVMRWIAHRVVIDESIGRADLETLLRQRMETTVRSHPGVDLLVRWTVAGGGALAAELRRGPLAAELLEGLRRQFGFGPPAGWSLGLEVDPPAAAASATPEDETIRGEFLRALRRLEADPAAPLGLEAYLPEWFVPSESAGGTRHDRSRRRLLREAALLGLDLLGGEGGSP